MVSVISTLLTFIVALIVSMLIIYFVATHRSELNVDLATGIFFIGAGFTAISLTVWNVKSNEVAEVK